MRMVIISLILTMNSAGVCFAQSSDSGPSVESTAPSIGVGDSVGGGYSSAGIGDLAGGSGYYSAGPESTGANAYSSRGVESSAGYGYLPVGANGGYGNPDDLSTEENESMEVQPSSTDTPADPNSKPDSNVPNTGSTSDPDGSQ